MELLSAVTLNNLICSLVGTVLYAAWSLLEKRTRTETQISLIYHMLHILVILMGLPYFWVFLCGRHEVDGVWSGNLMSQTPFTIFASRLLAGVWAAGFLWNLCRYGAEIYRYRRLDRNLLECRASVCDAAACIAGQMHIRRKVLVKESYALLFSELGSWVRPVIHLPAGQYDDESLTNIVTHELLHYKNGDKFIRELMLIQACFHWFNPVSRKILNQLKIWDEYHCDFETCRCGHIRQNSYCETLFHMYQLGETRKSLINPGFYEEKSDLRRRLEKMMNQENKKKTNRLRTGALALVFAVSGAAMGFMASVGMAKAYEKVVETTIVAEEETADSTEKKEYIEYTIMPDDTVEWNYVEMDEIMPLQDGDIFSCTLKNSSSRTDSFNVSIGQEISVSVSVVPKNVEIKVGIQQPNGVWRYVKGSELINHTFKVTQNGAHRVYVQNDSSTEVNVFGHYVITD